MKKNFLFFQIEYTDTHANVKVPIQTFIIIFFILLIVFTR